GVTAQKLFVVGATFVPAREKRAGEIKPFPIPALRDHVDLLPNLFLANLFRFLRIRNVEDAAFAITEAIDKESFVIRAKADIDGKNTAFHLADGRDLLCLPLAFIVRVNEPELRGQRGRGESVVM